MREENVEMRGVDARRGGISGQVVLKITVSEKKCLPSAGTSHKRVLPAEVAQLVEQGTENPRVGSSILSLGTIQKSDKDRESPV